MVSLGFAGVGHDLPRPLWIGVFIGPWVVALLAVIALGLLAVVNVISSVIRVELDGITVDVSRFWDRPRWEQGCRAAKLLCGLVVAATLVCVILLVPFAFAELGFLSVLLVPFAFLADALWVVFPLTGAILVLSVFVHVLGRRVQHRSESA